jgi:tetratricopeptide (TPR) repeat protein
MRGIFQPYQRSLDPITLRLVQDNYVESQARLAEALTQSGAYKASAKEYRLLGILKPGTAPAWVQAGNMEYQARDLKAAGEDWKRAAIEDPASAQALANIALYFYDTGDFDQALSQANKALALDPAMSNAQQIRALALTRVAGPGAKPAPVPGQDTNKGQQFAAEGDQKSASDPAGALAAYDKAVKAGFVSAGVHRNRGVMLMRLSRNAEAAVALHEAVAIAPKDPELYRYLGIMLYNSGQREEGATAIKKSYELDPKNAETQGLMKQIGLLK